MIYCLKTWPVSLSFMNFWRSLLMDGVTALLILLSAWITMAARIPHLLLIHLVLLLWLTLGISVLLWKVLGSEMVGYPSLRHWLLAGLLWPWVLNEARNMRQ